MRSDNTASLILPLNTWIHIVQTFSTTTGNYLYFNGTFIAGGTVPTDQPVGPYVTLGASPSGTGSIDEFRVFGRALSSQDISYLANL